MSDMHRERDPANYAYGVVLNPFIESGQRWDRSIGQWCQQAYLLRRVTLVNLGVSFLLLLLMIWLLTLPQTAVMALQISSNGFVSNYGFLDTEYDIPVGLKKTFLTQYVDNWSGRVSDSNANKKNRLFVLSYSGPEVQAFFQQMQSELTPGYLYNVRVQSIQSLSPNVFSVVWTVEKIQPGAINPSLTQAYQGTFDVQRSIPKTELALQNNPVGFYVDNVSIKPILIGESS